MAEVKKNGTNASVEETEEVTGEETTKQIFDFKLYVIRAVAKDKFGKVIRTKNGDSIFNYQLPIELRGRKSKVDFISIDKGGYEPLDIVYNGGDVAELSVIPYEMEINGKKQSGFKYELSTTDEDGIKWNCGVRPARQSDKDLLAMYLNILQKSVA